MTTRSSLAASPVHRAIGAVEAICALTRVAGFIRHWRALPARQIDFVADLVKTIMLPSDGSKPKRRQSETARHKTHSAASTGTSTSSFNPASVKSAPAPRRNHAADLTEASRLNEAFRRSVTGEIC